MGLVSQLGTRKPLEKKATSKKQWSWQDDGPMYIIPHFWDKPNLYPMIIPWSINGVRSVVSSHQQAINQASKLSDVRPNSAAERSKRKSGRQQLVASYLALLPGEFTWLSLCFVAQCFILSLSWYVVSCFGMSPFITSLDCKTLTCIGLSWKLQFGNWIILPGKRRRKERKHRRLHHCRTKAWKELLWIKPHLPGLSMHLEFQWIPISWFRKHSSWEPQQYWMKLRGTRQSWPKQCMAFSTTAGHHGFPISQTPRYCQATRPIKAKRHCEVGKTPEGEGLGYFFQYLMADDWSIYIYYRILVFMLLSTNLVSQCFTYWSLVTAYPKMIWGFDDGRCLVSVIKTYFFHNRHINYQHKNTITSSM